MRNSWNEQRKRANARRLSTVTAREAGGSHLEEAMGSLPAKSLPHRLGRAACCEALLATPAGLLAADVARSVAPQPPHARFAPSAAVTLVWFDVQQQLGDGFVEMASEVRSIFDETGVAVAWRVARDGDSYGEGEAREIAVIALAEDPSSARRAIPILGLVVRDAQPTRAFWAFVANVKRAVGIETRPGYVPSARESALLARALGRVVAHEVVHAIAPDHPHGAGLMKHALSRELLLGRRGSLGDECARSLRAALAHPPPAFPDAGIPAELIVAIP
jgi:hypothetical protein